MKKLIITLISILSVSLTHGQIINSVSPDKTGLYYYAVDSLTKLFQEEKQTKKIIIKTSVNSINDFPKRINNIDIEILDKKTDINYKKKDNGTVILFVYELTIIRDQVKILIRAFETKNKKLTPFLDFNYDFEFKYEPQNLSYRLNRLNGNLVKEE